MAKKVPLERLAAIMSKGFASANKKFTALAKDMAKIDTWIDSLDKRISSVDAKIDRMETHLSAKIDHLATKLTKFEETEIDNRKQLEVRVTAIERHLGLNKKIVA